ncbi:MAG: hypothetical protein K940chlam2_00565 [Chlamydiae bacterium]|nr:hypothetical protein [Chlamydiota bacterium]
MEEKLLDPVKMTDHSPGAPLLWSEPIRPKGMHFQKFGRKDKLPSLDEFDSPDKRAICLHRFGGHELLAVEIMAYALLAFPKAPKHFRRGVANTLRDEQEHVRLYQKEMERLGVTFDDLPLFRHFWAFTPHLTSPMEYISVMSLTLEMANLDFAPLFGGAFAAHGDTNAETLMKRILQDEIAHVSFGMHWLNKLKSPSLSSLESWQNALPDHISPRRARGKIFQKDARLAAGVPKEWVDHLTSLK